MLKGSNGFGGRRYQIAAAALTYAAVSLAAIPVYISHAMKEKPVTAPAAQVQQQPDQSSNSDNSAEPPDLQSGATAKPGENHPASNAAPKKEEEKMGAGKALGLLVLIGLASPFLELADPFHGLIGLFILFIGMQIAWKMTGRPKLVIDGPF